MILVAGVLATLLGIVGLLLLARPRWSAVPSAVIGIIGCAFLTIAGIAVSIFSWPGARLPEHRPVPASFDSSSPPPPSAGRQVRSNRDAIANWREIQWPPGGLRLEVPGDWRERQNDATRLDLRPSDNLDRFVDVRLLRVQDIRADEFTAVALLQSASRLAESRIEGYTQKQFGAAAGIVNVERKANGSRYQLTCNALAPNGQLLNVFVGAPAGDFDELEPVLGAIVDSIRIGAPAN